jgi:hypothetical protein
MTRSSAKREYIKNFTALVKATKLKPFIYSEVSDKFSNVYMSRFSYSKLIYKDGNKWSFSPQALHYLEIYTPQRSDYLKLLNDIGV